MPRWLINEERLKKQQELNNKRGSAIVITVSSESEAKQLAASVLRFGEAIKKVEKYWDAGPGSVCLRCCGIGHERQNSCGGRPKKCTLFAGAHSASEHLCGVKGCSKGRGKLCVHIAARCANCQGNHQANSTRCPARQKAEIQARKKTAKNHGLPVKGTTELKSTVETDNSAINDQDMDEREDWARSATEELSPDLSPESRDHTQDYQC